MHVSSSLQLAPADTSAFEEGPDVLAVHRDTPALLDPGVQICAPIRRLDMPTTAHDVGPFRVLLFHDRTGLALRHLVLPYHDLLSLPVLPFLWGDSAARTPFDPAVFWRPVANAPRSPSARADALAHARLFPSRHALDLREDVVAAQTAFLERVCIVQRIYPWMPADMDLQGACGYQGPHLSLALFSHPPTHPLWPALRGALDALAQRTMPGMLGLAQSWSDEIPVGQDPRRPLHLRRVPLDDDRPVSAHQRLAFHRDLWGTDAAPPSLPLPA